VDVGQGVHLRSFGGGGGRAFGKGYFAAKMKKTFPRKNQQLDHEANRRVLLFGNAIPMTFNSAITRCAIISAVADFIQSSPSDVSNIDEVYADFGINELERIYPIVAQDLGRRRPLPTSKHR